MGRSIIINVASDIEEITIRLGSTRLSTSPEPPVRCRAIKRNGKQCRHTQATARLNQRGLCPSHSGWGEAQCLPRER